MVIFVTTKKTSLPTTLCPNRSKAEELLFRKREIYQKRSLSYSRIETFVGNLYKLAKTLSFKSERNLLTIF